MARTVYPFLGTTTEFSKAFPNIKDVRVEIMPDIYGYYSRGELIYKNKHIYTRGNIFSKIHCCNPRCQQGGIDIGYAISLMTYTDETRRSYKDRCPGHEGSPKGRRMGDPCDNWHEISIKIEYLNKDEIAA